MQAAANAGKLIYGECGGYMVLGQSLTNKQGETHKMLGLLPHSSNIDRPRRQLGYRQLSHQSPLPWPKKNAWARIPLFVAIWRSLHELV